MSVVSQLDKKKKSGKPGGQQCPEMHFNQHSENVGGEVTIWSYSLTNRDDANGYTPDWEPVYTYIQLFFVYL